MSDMRGKICGAGEAIAMKAAALRNLGEVIYKRNLSDYNRIRENQGLQTKLEEMYKPLLTSQKSLLESSKTTSAKEIDVMKEDSTKCTISEFAAAKIKCDISKTRNKARIDVAV
jgi:hypothetical protein